MGEKMQSLHGRIADQKCKHEQNIIEHVNWCKKEFAEKIQTKEAQIKERIKIIEMKYDLKIKELMRSDDEKMRIERTQFKLQQSLMQKEIEDTRNNFKKEMQILKRTRPHSIVHVPLSGDNNKNGSNMKSSSSYSSQLQQYMSEQ